MRKSIYIVKVLGRCHQKFFFKYFRKILSGNAQVKILGAMAVYHGKQRVVLLGVVMSIAVHLGLVSSLFCAALALRPGWPARVHYVLAPIGLTINAIPLTPGGAGLGEGGMQFLFNSVGEDGAIAFAMMVAFRAMCWLIALVGVRFLVASFTETRQAIAEAQPGEPAAPLVPAEFLSTTPSPSCQPKKL